MSWQRSLWFRVPLKMKTGQSWLRSGVNQQWNDYRYSISYACKLMPNRKRTTSQMRLIFRYQNIFALLLCRGIAMFKRHNFIPPLTLIHDVIPAYKFYVISPRSKPLKHISKLTKFILVVRTPTHAKRCWIIFVTNHICNTSYIYDHICNICYNTYVTFVTYMTRKSSINVI